MRDHCQVSCDERSLSGHASSVAAGNKRVERVQTETAVKCIAH